VLVPTLVCGLLASAVSIGANAETVALRRVARAPHQGLSADQIEDLRAGRARGWRSPPSSTPTRDQPMRSSSRASSLRLLCRTREPVPGDCESRLLRSSCAFGLMFRRRSGIFRATSTA
jgi:hypothetical protein